MRKPKMEKLRNGQYRVRYTIAGKRMTEYFGSDQAEAEMRYAAWWASYSQAAIEQKVNAVVETTGFNVASGLPAVSVDHYTLSELQEMYVEWAKRFFVTRDRPGYHQELASQSVINILGDIYWSELDTVQFERYRQALLDMGKNRTCINQMCTNLLTWMKWCYAHKKISHRIDLELQSVKRLQPDDYGVSEKIPREPVGWEQVQQLFPFVSPNVVAMITLQYWSGMRPGEVCVMRPCELVWDGKMMYYNLAKHKTKRATGKSLWKVINWRGQRVLTALLRSCGDDEFIFKPSDAFDWAIEFERKRRLSRPTKVVNRDMPSVVRAAEKLAATRPARLKKHCGKRFTTNAYAMIIRAGFDRAERSGVNLVRWTPMQLRHGVMTMMGDNGLHQEGSHLLGHSKLETSLTHYDHERIQRLAIVAKRMEQIDPRPDDDDSDAAGAVTAA